MWTSQAVADAVKGKLKGRDFKNGKNMYKAAMVTSATVLQEKVEALDPISQMLQENSPPMTWLLPS